MKLDGSYGDVLNMGAQNFGFVSYIKDQFHSEIYPDTAMQVTGFLGTTNDNTTPKMMPEFFINQKFILTISNLMWHLDFDKRNFCCPILVRLLTM